MLSALEAADLAGKLWSFGSTLAGASKEHRSAVAKFLDEVAATLEQLKGEAAESGRHQLLSQLETQVAYGVRLLSDVLPEAEAISFGDDLRRIAVAPTNAAGLSDDETRQLSVVTGRLRGLAQVLRAPPASRTRAWLRQVRKRKLIATTGDPHILVTPPTQIGGFFLIGFSCLFALVSFLSWKFLLLALVGGWILVSWHARLGKRIILIALVSYALGLGYDIISRG